MGGHINSSYNQRIDKMSQKKKKTIALRVDGSRLIGMGHISSCIALASVLKRYHHVYFIIREDDIAVKKVRKLGYKVQKIRKNICEKDYIKKLLDILVKKKTDVVLFDLLEIKTDIYNKSSDKGIKCVLLDILGIYSNKIKLKSDILINRTIIPNRFKKYNLNDPTTKYYLGPDYAILRDEFIKSNKKKRTIKKVIKNILISFGGSDNNNITSRVLKVVNKIPNINVTVILGSVFKWQKELKSILKGGNNNNIRILQDVENMARFMEECDLAICSGGLTAYELACSGTPSLTIVGYKHEAEQASEFEKRGSLVNLGLYTKLDDSTILNSIKELMKDYRLRESMSIQGKQITDGAGAYRICRIINGLGK